MPYKIFGKTVKKLVKGRWIVVGHSDNPKEYLKALYANSPEGKRSTPKEVATKVADEVMTRKSKKEKR